MPVKEGTSKPTIDCGCNRCGHQWQSEKGIDQLPVQCPKCKSTYWNKPRREKKEKGVERKKVEVKSNGSESAKSVAIKPTSNHNSQPLKEISKAEFLKLAKKGKK